MTDEKSAEDFKVSFIVVKQESHLTTSSECPKNFALCNGIPKIFWHVESGIPGLGFRNTAVGSFTEKDLESSNWIPESTAWNLESKTLLDSLIWGKKFNFPLQELSFMK